MEKYSKQYAKEIFTKNAELNGFSVQGKGIYISAVKTLTGDFIAFVDSGILLKQNIISYNLYYGISFKPLIEIGESVLEDNIYKHSAVLYCLGKDTVSVNSYIWGILGDDDFEKLVEIQFREFFLAHELWALQNADLNIMLDKNLLRDDYVAQVSVPILAKLIGREEVVTAWTKKVRDWNSRVDEYEEMIRRLANLELAFE